MRYLRDVENTILVINKQALCARKVRYLKGHIAQAHCCNFRKSLQTNEQLERLEWSKTQKQTSNVRDLRLQIV